MTTDIRTELLPFQTSYAGKYKAQKSDNLKNHWNMLAPSLHKYILLYLNDKNHFNLFYLRLEH